MNTAPESIAERAAEFLVELSDPGPGSEQLEEELAEWLSASPEHEAAFTELSKVFDQLSGARLELPADRQARLSKAPSNVVPLRPGRASPSPCPPKPIQDSSPRRPAKGLCPEIVGRVLAALAGYDLQLVPRYAGADAEHERKRLVRIGASVLIPALLGCFSVFLLLGSYAVVMPARIVMATIAALLILLIDSIVVTTLSRRGGAGVLLRLVIAACMAMVTTEPLLLCLYSKSIDAHITAKFDADLRSREQAYVVERDSLESDAARLGKRQSADLSQLQNFAPEHIALYRINRLTTQRAELLAKLRAQQSKELDTLNKMQGGLYGAREKIQGQIDGIVSALHQEEAGLGASGRRGAGPVFSALEKDLRLLESELAELNARVAAVDAEIDATIRNGPMEKVLQRNLTAITNDSPSTSAGSLSPEEAQEKRTLETEIAGLGVALAETRRQQQQVGFALERLPRDLALSTRGDTLARTEALYELISDNWLVGTKVGALFLLLFLIDMAPVIIKLTSRAGYEEYLRSVTAERRAKIATTRNAYEEEVLSTGTARMVRLNEFSRIVLAGLPRSGGEEFNLRYMRAISNVERAVGRMTDEIIRDTQCGPSETGRTRWRALPRTVWRWWGWSVLRAFWR